MVIRQESTSRSTPGLSEQMPLLSRCGNIGREKPGK
jgi:hypothetical protein